MTFDEFCNQSGHYAENGDRAMWDAAVLSTREAAAKALELTDSEIRLMAGEMTGQELRTVQAVLKARATVIRNPELDLIRRAK